MGQKVCNFGDRRVAESIGSQESPKVSKHVLIGPGCSGCEVQPLQPGGVVQCQELITTAWNEILLMQCHKHPPWLAARFVGSNIRWADSNTTFPVGVGVKVTALRLGADDRPAHPATALWDRIRVDTLCIDSDT